MFVFYSCLEALPKGMSAEFRVQLHSFLKHYNNLKNMRFFQDSIKGMKLHG